MPLPTAVPEASTAGAGRTRTPFTGRKRQLDGFARPPGMRRPYLQKTSVFEEIVLSPWFAKAAVSASSVAMVAIRAPYGQLSRRVNVVKSRKGPMETVLLTLAWIGFFVPLVWIASPWLRFADYPLGLVPFVAGAACQAVGLWVFRRSHADLGTNWSISLELRERHQLVTSGVYRRVRHPMYAALLLYAIGQALVIPNRVAGPSYLVPMALMVALRLAPEERMMVEEFGERYREYSARSKRLIPKIW
jgi:protein-S-isoprenylcysteine O-methyltransferase Ste14